MNIKTGKGKYFGGRGNTKLKRSRLIKFSALICVVLLIAAICIFQDKSIQLEHFNVGVMNLPPELSGLKIAQISDVHLRSDCREIDEIIDDVKKEKPDIIVITGDIIDESANINSSGLGRLCKGLSDVTETYSVAGNHEIYNDYDKWVKVLTQNNVNVIDNRVEIYTKNNKSLAIIGLKNDYEYNPLIINNIDKAKGLPRILLAHHPELFPTSYAAAPDDIRPDVVFSGHAHGGQVRIPIFDKALYAPNQGFLPKYTSGQYILSGSSMIVSRGLGNSTFPIRVNDRYDIPVVVLTAK